MKSDLKSKINNINHSLMPTILSGTPENLSDTFTLVFFLKP
ncbi:hypothetical protein THOE12_50014 [Vibrio rotiferianus]|nr:hypothetical protein THOE12_50014 [Vibrio rotiferianus]